MNKTIMFADRLREARQRAGISQAELSRRTGIASATLSSYEKGKMPPIDKAFQIAETLNVSLDWLCGSDSETLLNSDSPDPEKIMQALLIVLSVDGLCCDDTTNYEYIESIIINNPTVEAFLHEYLKIKVILDNPDYEKYLKDGLLKTVIEKFKKQDFSIHHSEPSSSCSISDDEVPF